MKKLYFTLLTILGLTTFTMAQYVDNALLFSQQNYGSTARSKAMGNAFGALGGDFSSLSINPAGIGIYQRGEVSATMSLINKNTTDATYQNNINSDTNNSFNFKNLGYVSSIPMATSSNGLISLNFGIGYNRLANFNSSSIAGANAVSYSRMDAFANNTNGINFNSLVSSDSNDPYHTGIPWESKLAWENYLIDVTNPTTGGNQYSTFLFANEKVKQLETAHHEGYINEYIATIGANYNHNFYIGATVGMQDIFYDEAKLYGESGDWGKFDYSNNSRVTGVGYNLKVGAIYRPIPILRLGLAVHTPTFFNVKETYSSSMTSNLVGINTNANGAHSEFTPIGNYQYNFTTPMRTIASIALQLAKKGMISVDYEMVDYGSMKYSKGSDSYNFGTENGQIKSIYKTVGNLRAGAELRLTDAFSVRGGVELLGNPYKTTIDGITQPNTNYQFKTYSGGIGYRSGNYSLDFTYSLGDKTNYMYLYQLDGMNIEPVKYHSQKSELLFTLAIRL